MGNNRPSAVLIAAAVVLIAALGLFFARIWWASQTPIRPTNIPATSIWIPAPAAPFDLSPRGWWMGCRLDAHQSSNRCYLADRQGRIEFDDEYRPLTGSSPVPEAELTLSVAKYKREHLWTASNQLRREIPIARLANGQVLVPIEALDEFRNRAASGGTENQNSKRPAVKDVNIP